MSVRHCLYLLGLFILTLTLNANEPLKIVYNAGTPPLKFTHNNQPTGMLIDIWKLWAKKTGHEIVFVEAPWEETLLMLKDGRADVHAGIYHTREREAFLDYSAKPLYENKNYFFYHKSLHRTDVQINVTPYVIGIGNGFPVSFMKQNYPTITTKAFEKDEEVYLALMEGKIKVTLSALPMMSYALKTNNSSLDTVDYNAANPVFVEHYFGAVKKGNHALLNAIDEGFNKISEEELSFIERQWTLNLDLDTFVSSHTKGLSLTQNEQKWLKEKRVIRYSEVNWEPLSIIEDGRMKGILGDYLDIVAEKTGIVFEFIPSSSWPDVLEKFKKGEIDLIPGIGDSKEEFELGNVSQKYASYPMVIISNETIAYVKSLENVKEKVFSIPKYYTGDNYIKARFPQTKIIETKDIPEALHNVAEKKADIFVGHIAPALYHIEKMGQSNLKVVGETDFTFNHHFLTTPKYPELLSIINKVIDNIDVKEKEKIYHEWVHTELKEAFDYSLLYKAGFAIALLFGIFIYYNQKINLQKRFVQTLLNSQEQMIISNNGQEIVSGNRAFMTFFGVESINAFMAQYGAKCVCDLFNTKAPSGFLQKMMGDTKWIDYVIDNKDKSVHKVMISKENKHFIFSVTAALLPGKEGLKSAVFTDITFMENAKVELESMYKHTQESIEYASLIQHAIIPPDELFEKFFNESFTLWEPKDIVGGDIYLFEKLRHEDECLVMLIDCTGHGVPGAFVTMLVKAIEQLKVSYIMNSEEPVSPAKILSFFNQNMKHLLKQENKNASSNAGFDGAIVYVNTKERFITYAGAQLPLFYVEDSELRIIKGDRHSVGYKNSDALFEFTEHTLHVKENMAIYLSTDGFLDQIGGEQQFSFGKRRFSELIGEHFQKPMREQKCIFKDTLSLYQGANDRNDDVTMIGLRL